MPSLHVVVLAAGKGTRMKSARPKVLHEIAGLPMLAHVLEAAARLRPERVHVVVGHGAVEVRERFAGNPGLGWVLQSQQKGTGHAVKLAMKAIPDSARVLILYGDVPLVQAPTILPLVRGKSLALLTARLPDPGGYGRVLRDPGGAVQGIVEQKDASPAQRRVNEINTGILAAPAGALRKWLGRLRDDNAKREYYLTDIVSMAVDDGVGVEAHDAQEATQVMGVNDRVQLAQAERQLQRRQAEKLMKGGLALRDPDRFDLRGSLKHGKDVLIDVGVVIEGKVQLGDGVYVGPYTLIRDARIAAGTRIESHSVLDSVTVGRNCRIGPFARLRPETVLADEVHVGNFVEVKKVRVGKGSKANHLAYLGDGQVGKDVNVGAGTIFCNYDGANKHRTVLGDGVFVGSDTQLVAPVTVGKGATIAAGSTITKNVPAGGLTIARARGQKTVTGWKRPRKK